MGSTWGNFRSIQYVRTSTSLALEVTIYLVYTIDYNIERIKQRTPAEQDQIDTGAVAEDGSGSPRSVLESSMAARVGVTVGAAVGADDSTTVGV